MEGLEPPSLAALDPKSSASTISPHPLLYFCAQFPMLIIYSSREIEFIQGVTYKDFNLHYDYNTLYEFFVNPKRRK
jgi:hypothetical protein